jgi:hypothetical protein
MTLYRAPGSIDAILIQTIGLLSPDEVRRATGKDQSHFYKIANPGNRWDLHFRDAIALDAALLARGQAAAFGPLLAEQVQEVQQRLGVAPRRPALAPETAVRRLMMELGQLAEAVDRAMADGTVTAAERRDISREAQEIIETARALRDSVEPAPALRSVGA